MSRGAFHRFPDQDAELGRRLAEAGHAAGPMREPDRETRQCVAETVLALVSEPRGLEMVWPHGLAVVLEEAYQVEPEAEIGQVMESIAERLVGQQYNADVEEERGVEESGNEGRKEGER